MDCQGSKLEENVINCLLLTHDPAGRQFDSGKLLHATKNIMFHATASQENHYFAAANNAGLIERIGSEELIECTIYRILNEMSKYGEGDDLHKKTMFLFDLLGDHRWEEKVVLALTAFAMSYGEFWVLTRLCLCNPIAASIVMLKQMPRDITRFKLQFKALAMLVKSMIDLAECIIKFEGLPFSHIELDYATRSTAKTHTYVAAYWVIRSSLICYSQIKDLMGVKPEKVNYNSTTIATWELSTLVIRLSRICKQLNQQVETCDRKIETKLHQKLSNLFEETQPNGNQEVLRVLFAMNEEFPLRKHSSEAKVGTLELINKVVVLLISKPDLLPIERTLFTVHQTRDHPRGEKLEASFEIIWVPISLSNSWTDADEINFQLLSNSLPFYSIRRPWLLNTAIVKFIKEKWNYTDEPVMVVLDTNGRVSNTNAFDMVSIWGAKAYPFPASREKELWSEEKWTLQILVNDTDPLLTMWVKEGRLICIYGGCNLKWIREFTGRMKEIKKAGVQIEVVYVGGRNPGHDLRTVLDIVDAEKISRSLSFMKICFFWLRLESIRRSKLKLEHSSNNQNDHLIEKVSEIVNIMEEVEDGWAVIGSGSCSDIFKVQGSKHMECLNLFTKWKDNVAKFGFVGALRTAMEPPLVLEPCGHSKVISYREEVEEGSVSCEKCKRLMKKFIIYE